MSARITFALVLTLAACGGEPTTTMTDGGTGGSTGTTDAATGTGTGTGDTPTSTSSTSGDTGGTGGGTESASGTDTTGAVGSTGEMLTEGGGSGGQGSGMACVKWYGAIAESYGPICECEVQKGTFETVEECLMTLAPPADCACSLFAESPETADLLLCYEKAAKAKTKCLENLNLCIGNVPLDLCIKEELDAYLECGTPSAELCQNLKNMCGEAVPAICGP